MNRYKALIVCIGFLLGLSLVLVIFVFPVRHLVKGQITDWIGNDNGFGIKIDGVIYWCDYNGHYYGCDNQSYTDLLGKNLILEYVSTFWNIRGMSGNYVHVIYFNITNEGFKE